MVKNTIRPNHMHVYWHDYTGGSKDLPLLEAGLTEKSILVGRIGLMLLSCGTGAWRVRSAHEFRGRAAGTHLYDYGRTDVSGLYKL